MHLNEKGMDVSLHSHKAAYVWDGKLNNDSTESSANIFVSGVVKYLGTGPAMTQI